jgi:hypothetical protein
VNPAYQPYLILGLIALAVASYKGVIPIPSLPRPRPRGADRVSAKDADPVQHGQGACGPADPLGYLPSEVIALAFAKAVRREAEDEVARKIASEAGDQIRAKFTGPFSEGGEPAPR